MRRSCRIGQVEVSPNLTALTYPATITVLAERTDETLGNYQS
jgi:hypothetical protein